MHRIAKISLLLFFFALCAAAILATHFAAQRAPAPPARELYLAVNRQLSALRAADFGSAYRNAAAGVQQKFSLQQFERMIRRDFWPMTRGGRVEFGDVQIAAAKASVRVFLTAPDGMTRGFLYSFSAEAGDWKIDGIQSLGSSSLPRWHGLHA